MSDADHVPSWVPEIAPGVRADVYPVEPPRPSRTPYCDSPPELVLDRHAVTVGYAERRLPYEFGSCLPAAVVSLPAPPLSSALPGSIPPSFNPASGSGLTTSDLLKLRTGIAQLRRSRPTKLQRVEQHTFIPPKPSPSNTSVLSLDASVSFASKNSFPLQKPSGSSSLEDWFNKLSSGASFNTSELSRSVPLGPAIVRAAGKVIEMMATRSVPTQRAAWYIRIAVLNECVKQIRPDRAPPSPRAFWTKQLCQLLKTEIDQIRLRKTAILGSMDRVSFWEYVLDLARWQADEDLLDIPQWLAKVALILRQELLSAQNFNSPGTRIAMGAARRFLPEFLSSRVNARLLLESLVPGADAIVKAWRGVATVSAKSDSNGGSSGHVKRDPKSASRKGTQKRPFTPNLCHREVTMLLSAMVRFLDDNIVGNAESETRMSDLERFVKRGISIIFRTRSRESADAKKLVEKGVSSQPGASQKNGTLETDISPHRIIRELEMLPGHGDVGKVAAALQVTAVKRGGLRGTVKQLCEWAVDGPVSDRPEAICVGSAVLAFFGTTAFNENGNAVHQGKPFRHVNEDIHKPRSETVDNARAPPLQREIWHFLKEFSRGRKPALLDNNDQVVRFIAQLCRTGQLSLRILVRDISRLASHSHPGSGYLLRCLALLPDPVHLDHRKKESISSANLDCRRPLLRKFGFISNTRQTEGKGVDEQVVRAVFGGDFAVMEQEANRLIKTGDTNRILSTAEAVRLSIFGNFADTSAIGSQVVTIPSFMLMVDEPTMAVQWLMGGLSDILDGQGIWASEPSKKKKNEVLLHLVRQIEDMSRYIAASGFLEDVFYLMKRIWLSSWVSFATQKRVLFSNATLAKNFVGDVDGISPYWSKIVAKHLRQKGEGASAAKVIPLAMAGMRGQLEGNPSQDVKLDDILNNVKNDFFSADEDLLQAVAHRQLHGTPVEEIRTRFMNTEIEFPLDAYLAIGFTANDIFGTVFIPILAEALAESTDGTIESSFSPLVVSSLKIIHSRQDDVRLQGVRPPLLLEFISLILVGSLSGHTHASESLEVLVGMGWVWKTLAPGAGIALAKKLRARVDYHCDRIGPLETEGSEKGVVSALLFNMVTRFSGGISRDEAVVTTALGSEPFGMIDMQLSLLATHRHECGDDEEFGSRICDAAVSHICPDSARTLASVALQCCTKEESKHIVAGLVGYGAVQAMAESLSFVVKGLTVDASKNSALHQERAAQWFQADTARRSILECIVESLSQEVGVQVETVLFDQLATATVLLTNARDRDCMPSSLFEDGRRISEALESRLHGILRSQRTPQNVEVWTQRTLQVAELLRCAVPVMRKSALAAASNVLMLCIRNLAECCRSSERSGQSTTASFQMLDAVKDLELKEELQKLLKPVMFWLEEAERKKIGELIQVVFDRNVKKNMSICAYNADGAKVDSWVLLEGYGRGPDEEAAVPPTCFGKQGRKSDLEDLTPAVQLKRTYSTFSSLAV